MKNTQRLAVIAKIVCMDIANAFLTSFIALINVNAALIVGTYHRK